MPGQGWYAPSLHPPPAGSPAGAARTSEEILALLRDGQTARDTVLGPMAEVVRHSTQYWTEADLRAVAQHLANLPPAPAGAGGSGGSDRDPAGAYGSAQAQTVRDQGARLYADHCADCHGPQGEGVAGAYPALAGNATVQHPDARNLAQVVRLGGFPPTTAAHPRPYGMPPQRLSDGELAALLTYLRQSWGHRAGAVTPLEILQWR
jgi:mono/diheme cytochrome c family protein